MLYDLEPYVPVDWNWLKTEYARLQNLAEAEKAGSEDGEASEDTLNKIMAIEAIGEADAVIELARMP